MARHAWIAPPDGFAGSVNLVAELRGLNGEVADRQMITLEGASPIAPVPVLRQRTESTTLASISPKPVRGIEQHRTGRSRAATTEACDRFLDAMSEAAPCRDHALDGGEAVADSMDRKDSWIWLPSAADAQYNFDSKSLKSNERKSHIFE